MGGISRAWGEEERPVEGWSVVVGQASEGVAVDRVFVPFAWSLNHVVPTAPRGELGDACRTPRPGWSHRCHVAG